MSGARLIQAVVDGCAAGQPLTSADLLAYPIDMVRHAVYTRRILPVAVHKGARDALVRVEFHPNPQHPLPAPSKNRRSVTDRRGEVWQAWEIDDLKAAVRAGVSLVHYSWWIGRTATAVYRVVSDHGLSRAAKRRISESARARIRAGYEADEAGSAIAGSLGWTVERVWGVAAKMGLPAEGRARGVRPLTTALDVDVIRRAAAAGLSAAEIAPRLHRSQGMVYRIAYSHGIAFGGPSREKSQRGLERAAASGPIGRPSRREEEARP